MNLGFILDYIYQGEVNLYQDQLDSFLESAQKLEIEGLLGEDNEDNEDSETNLKEETFQFEALTTEQGREGDLVKMNSNPIRQYKVAQNNVEKLDVTSLTPDEIEGKRKELYQKIDEVWRCLACDYISSYAKSSAIRLHVETHLDGLCFTCDICNKDFSSRRLLAWHKNKVHI